MQINCSIAALEILHQEAAIACVVQQDSGAVAVQLFPEASLGARESACRNNIGRDRPFLQPQSRERPFFCVVLADGNQWSIKAERSDGTIERFGAFRAHLDAVNWIHTLSEAWQRERI